MTPVGLTLNHSQSSSNFSEGLAAAWYLANTSGAATPKVVEAEDAAQPLLLQRPTPTWQPQDAAPQPTPTMSYDRLAARNTQPLLAARPRATPAPVAKFAAEKRIPEILVRRAEDTPSHLRARWEGEPDHGAHNGGDHDSHDEQECHENVTPRCKPKTNVHWVQSIKTIAEASPKPCVTVQKTSTYWATELREWKTTVYPVTHTEWVYRPEPILVTQQHTDYIESVRPATPPKSPPCQHPDICNNDGNGDWDWHWHHDHEQLVAPLTSAQIVTLVMIPIFLLFDLFVWPNHIVAVVILLPLQLYTNLAHELFHLAAGVLGGATICSVTIDPGCGPLSTMRNGSPLFTLVSGYIGSQILGGFYVALAFDERCSKITYLIHAPLWPAVFWFTVGVWPKIQMLIWVGASISLWFIWEARLLRFYMLFLGLLSLFYVLWDVVDDFFFHRTNESDASLLGRLKPSIKPGVWAVLFLFTACGTLTCSIIAGLHYFPGDIHAASMHFLPT